MATKYVRTIGGAWNVDATWSTTSGGPADTTAATSADDVILDSNSGNLGITTNRACRSLDCTSGTGTYTGTITHSATRTLTIGDGTAGVGNVALKFDAGMTYTLGDAATSAILFASTSTTQQTITTAGKTLGNVTFSGAGGKWQLQDAFTTSPTATITLTTGEFYGNGQTINTGKVGTTNGSTTKVLDITNCAINIAGLTGGGWVMGDTATNMTVTVTGSTITLTSTANNNIFKDRRLAAQAYNNVVLNKNSGALSLVCINGAKSCVNLTLTSASYAVKTSQIPITNAFTVTGLLTISGNSAINRLLISSQNGSQDATPGAAVTITAAAVSIIYADFMDITAAGAAIPFTGTSLGDCQGNSNITFDTPVTRYGVAAGNWDSTAMWSTLSGGAPGASVPLPQDDVVLDANSGSGTYTLNMPRPCKNLTCTGFTRTLSLGIACFVYGSVILGSGMTFSGNFTVQVMGRGSYAITSAGVSFPGAFRIANPGGTYTLQDDLSVPNSVFSAWYGTFTTNNYSILCSTFDATTGTTTLNLGTSSITITSTAASTVFSTAATLTTTNGSNATVIIANVASGTRTIGLSNHTIGTFTYTVANSPGVLYFQPSSGGNSAITTLNIGSGRGLQIFSGRTLSVTNFNVEGADNGYIYLPGVSNNYISAPDSVPLSITGDIELIACISQPTWSTTGAYISKYVSSLNASYMLANVGGNLTLFTSASLAGTLRQVTSTVALSSLGWTANSPHWVKSTRVASTGVVQFFTSNDSASTDPESINWTQLGIDRSTTIESIYDGTQELQLGCWGSASYLLNGSIYRAIIKNGVAGNIVFDADLTTKPFGADTFTESSVNAATVTINGVAAQVGDGRVRLVSSTGGSAGTLSKSSGIVSCDYLTIQDSTATGGAAWYAGANSINISGNTGWIFTDPPNGNFFLMF